GKLLQVVLAVRAIGGFPDVLHRGQDQAHQHAQDRKHNQQFDQRESITPTRAEAPTGMHTDSFVPSGLFALSRQSNSIPRSSPTRVAWPAACSFLADRTPRGFQVKTSGDVNAHSVCVRTLTGKGAGLRGVNPADSSRFRETFFSLPRSALLLQLLQRLASFQQYAADLAVLFAFNRLAQGRNRPDRLATDRGEG